MTNLHADARALIVLREHWPCIFLRAELLERGRPTTCAPSFGTALLSATDPTVEPAHVLLLEQEALTARDRAVLSSSTLLQAPPALLLLTSATAEAAGGPWRRVLRRPAALGSLADAVEDAFRTPARPDAVESKVGAEAPRRPVFSSRRGDPWPMVRCDGCGASRHDETPRTAADEDLVGAEQLKFALEHAACAVRAGA